MKNWNTSELQDMQKINTLKYILDYMNLSMTKDHAYTCKKLSLNHIMKKEFDDNKLHSQKQLLPIAHFAAGGTRSKRACIRVNARHVCSRGEA